MIIKLLEFLWPQNPIIHFHSKDFSFSLFLFLLQLNVVSLCGEKKNPLLILKCFRVARIKQNVCVPEGESWGRFEWILS